MLIPYIALILLVIVLMSGFYFMINTVMLSYSFIKGSPFLKTKSSVIRQIMKEAGIKQGTKLLDLGCGDGVVVRIAAKEFGAEATGVDVNFLLILRANIMKKIQKIKNATFIRQNIYDTDIYEADALYIFLLPRFMSNLRRKLLDETKKGALIISHGFRIEGWEKYLVKKIPNKPFPTYFYKLSDEIGA